MGSVIRPAAFCGIYGFKPTYGLIPRPGVLTQAPSLDTVGVFGRSLEDLALLADALQGYDERDPASMAPSRPDLSAPPRRTGRSPPMFAFVKTHAWAEADRATHEAFGELVEELGDRCRGDFDRLYHRARFRAAETRGQKVEMAHAVRLPARPAPELSATVCAEQLEEGRRVTGIDYFAALDARNEFYETVEEPVHATRTILTPAALGPAPKGLEAPEIRCSAGFGPISACPA